MESIFHEKQEGYLCAQHCLNALLQGSYFNAVDLANLAQQMDEEERLRMAESGLDSDDYRRFMQQPSENMDDSGYFSVQVISSALKVWGLELIPYNSTEPAALIAQNDPSRMKAYICNYKGHWFTIRKLGNQWFNLNSVLSGPQLLSDTFLSMFIAQLIQEGYSIFIVIGKLPECTADAVILKNPVTTASKSKPDQAKPESSGYRLGTAEEDERKIQQAVADFGRVKVPGSSLAQSSSGGKEKIIPIVLEDDDDDEYDEKANLEKALQLSLQDEEADKSLKLRLNLNSKPSPEQEEDDELRKALQLSLECVTAPTTPDPDDLRWRRLAFLNNLSRSGNESKLNT